MAEPKLQVSTDLFKSITLECNQLRLTHQLLEAYSERALRRGHELEDYQLGILLDQVNVLVSKAAYLNERLEKLVRQAVVIP